MNSMLEVEFVGEIGRGGLSVNKTGEIQRECAGEYQDALGVLAPSEESREKVCKDVGVKQIDEREMTVSRLIGVSRVSVSCSADRVDYGPVLVHGGMPGGKPRPDPVAPAFSDDSDDVSPLAGGVLNSLGRTLSQ